MFEWIIKIIGGTDRLLHYLMCWALFLSFKAFLPCWIAALIVLAIGIGKEVIDIFRGTGFDWGDLCLDICGILTGWAVVWLSSFVG